MPRLVGTLTVVTASDADFDSVTAASAMLALLWESREPLEARGIEQLPALLRAPYERAVFLGHRLQEASWAERISVLPSAQQHFRPVLRSCAKSAIWCSAGPSAVPALGKHPMSTADLNNSSTAVPTWDCQCFGTLYDKPMPLVNETCA